MKIVSFNGVAINDGSAFQSWLMAQSHGLPQFEANIIEQTGAWPKVIGVTRQPRKLVIDITILDAANKRAHQKTLYNAFNPENGIVSLVLADDDGSNQRQLQCQPVTLRHVEAGNGVRFIASCIVHGDVYARSIATFSDTLNATASGQTITLNNAGDLEVYPTIKLTPTSAKSADFAYKIWIPIRWRAGSDASNYPINLTNGGLDTASLVTAGKMLASGDDLQVYINGSRVDRWLDGMNTAGTSVWVSLDFQTEQETALSAGFLNTDTITQLSASGDISGFPASGILYSPTHGEAFVYTGKDEVNRLFTGVTRAAKGTTAATHSAGDLLAWVQHDIYINYGDSGAGADTSNANTAPAFLLSSTNEQWIYNAHFGGDTSSRSQQWQRVSTFSSMTFYGGEFATSSATWDVMGQAANTYTQGRWQLYNPCGIASFRLTGNSRTVDGTFSSSVTVSTTGGDVSEWISSYTIPTPVSVGGWDTWDSGTVTTSGGDYKFIGVLAGYSLSYTETKTATITLDSLNTPVVYVGSEQGNYTLSATITNETTGIAITANFTMELNETLTINTANKTVTYDKDGSSQFQAFGFSGDIRHKWLPLATGNNTIRIDDTGMTGMTVYFEWNERYY